MTDLNPPRPKVPRKKEETAPAGLPEDGVRPLEGKKTRRRNAGFYAKTFTHQEVVDLEMMDQAKLCDEIAVLRVAMRRCFEAGSTMEVTDMEGWVKVLSSLGMAATRLAGLLRSQQFLSGGGENELLTALSTALSEVRKEMGV